MTNATTLRTMVIDNRWTASRLSQAQLGSGEDYRQLTTLYKNALDALTVWAGKDYAHTSTKEDVDNAFTQVKAILDLFTTDDSRIIIDQASMRTLRDCATKPKRLYSQEYTIAKKAQTYADKVVKERLADLITLGAPALAENETAQDYATRIREAGINTVSGTIDILEMYLAASSIATIKAQAVKDIMERGNYTWRRPVAVSQNEFADLVENYVGDCLEEGYNIKSSKEVRDEKKAEAARKKAEKSIMGEHKVDAEINAKANANA